MKLTIAIPTYNRNQLLRENLELLIPQLTGDCRLLILDNCSDVPVADTLADLWEKMPAGVEREVIRHPVNVGACANVLRAFELCTTEWLWVLSDDDFVASNAVSTILHRLSHSDGVIFYHFPPPLRTRSDLHYCENLDELIRQMENYGDVMWLSMGIYRAPVVRSYMRHGYRLPWNPHVALLFWALLEGRGKAILCPERIITRVREGEWSALGYAQESLNIVHLPVSHKTRLLLIRKILECSVSLRVLAHQAALYGIRTGDSTAALFFFDRAYRNFSAWHTKLSTPFAYRFYRWAIKYPRLGAGLFHTFWTLRYGRVKAREIQEKFSRQAELGCRL